MKKSFLLILALPLLLAGCDLTPVDNGSSNNNGSTETNQNGSSSGHHSHNTGGQSGTGTEGSGTGEGSQTSGGSGDEYEESTDKDVSKLGLEVGDKPTTIKLTDEITLTCDKKDGNNAPAYYSAELRFYVGNTLTISNSKGIISRIILRYSDSTGDNVNSFTSNVGSMTDYQTWTGSASSVTFTVENENDTKSGHLKLYSLKVTYTSHLDGTTGGGSETGGGTSEGGTQTGGGGTVSTTDYTSTWPSDCQKYIKSYVNGMVPCYLNANKKCLFNTYQTSSLNNGCIPVYTAQVKNTSPDINYTYDYGGILRDANFTYDGTEDDEDGDTWYYYSKGLCQVMYAKYKSDNVYYFDVRMYYEYYNENVAPNAYTIQHDDKTLSLSSKYESNNKTVSVNGWSIKLNDIQKQGEKMQLKKDTGKITITGSIKSVYVEVLRNGDALFVKAGTNASNAQYIFNNGGAFEFPSGTTYVEISAVSRVLEFEFLELAK